MKNMKRHLRHVVQRRKFTEELRTVPKQIEAVVNSRPSSRFPHGPNDWMPFTPPQFLINGSFLSSASEPKVALNTRFRLLQEIQKDFWTAWTRAYLITVQVRKMWPSKGFEINVGDFVLIAEDSQKPLEKKLVGLLVNNAKTKWRWHSKEDGHLASAYTSPHQFR